MERQVEMAVQEALSLARARGGKLAALTLRGSGQAAAILEVARNVLKRMGRQGEAHAEVHVQPPTAQTNGHIELLSIEVVPAARR